MICQILAVSVLFNQFGKSLTSLKHTADAQMAHMAHMAHMARLSPLAYSSNSQHNLNHQKVNSAPAVKTLSNKQPVSQQANQATNNKYISQPTLSNQMAVHHQISAMKPPMQLNNIPNSMQQQQHAIRPLLTAQPNNPFYNNLLYNQLGQYGK